MSQSSFRPPAVPLVTHDPHFSIWSPADKLTDSETKHWSNLPMPIHSLVYIDGNGYRLMGTEPSWAPPARQVGLEVWPTRSIYRFEQNGVSIKLTFLSPLLIDDLELVSRPITYIIYDVVSLDGSEHDVRLYFDASSEVAVNEPDANVAFTPVENAAIPTIKAGMEEQNLVATKGDLVTQDWGYALLAAENAQKDELLPSSLKEATETFTLEGKLPPRDVTQPRKVDQDTPVLALLLNLGTVGNESIRKYAIFGYDDIYAIEYFGKRLRAYWRRDDDNERTLVEKAASEFESIVDRCERFDKELFNDLKEKEGEQYAHISTLAYRQCIAAHKLAVDDDGTLLYFSKENYSNGCMGTVDVTYPSSPFFLLFNTDLMKAMIAPLFEYAASDRWPWPYAPHDIGRYPHANGQVYGGGEETEDRQMPVEECGNMLTMVAGLAKVEGNADFAEKYWALCQKWAAYLLDKGLDPENQLCTDDFAGHLARNANLSAKAIMGIASFGLLCQMRGLDEEGQKYLDAAKAMVTKWMEMADDGDHYSLTFENPGTWSQKYNFVWDKLLGLNLVPESVFKKEIAHYLKVQNRYGLPLDSRSSYTKLDWILWTTILAENQEDAQALIEPVYRFLQESQSRIPMTDWYWTKEGKLRGFRGRSVVGGVFIRMLARKLEAF